MILVYPKPHLLENEQYTIRLQNKSQRTATAVFYFKANWSLDQRRPPPAKPNSAYNNYTSYLNNATTQKYYDLTSVRFRRYICRRKANRQTQPLSTDPTAG